MTSEEKRLVALQKKLDQLNYPQTLHPHSVQLVEKLLSDYSKLTLKYQTLKKNNQNSAPSSGGQNLQAKVKNLQNQLDTITTLKQQARQENQQLKKKLLELQDDQRIKKIQARLQNSILDYQTRIQALNQKISTLQLQNQQYLTKINYHDKDSLKVHSLLQQRLAETQKCASQLTNRLEKKNSEIQRQFEEKQKLSIQISSLEKVIDDLNSQKNQLFRDKSNTTNKLSELLREELSTAENKNQILRLALGESNSEIEKLKLAVKNLNQKLILTKNEEIMAKESEVKQSNTRSELGKKYAQTQQQLKDARSQLKRLENERSQDGQVMKRQEKQIQDLKKKEKNLSDNVKSLEMELGVLVSKHNQKIKECRESENLRISLERQLKLQEHDKMKKMEDCLPNTIKQIDQQSLQRAFEKKEKEYQYQIHTLQEQINELKKNQHKILIERDRALSEVQKLNAIASEGNNRIEIIQNQKEGLMKENKDLQKLLNNIQSTDFNSKNQIIRLTQKLSSHQLLVTDLRSSVKSEKNKWAALSVQFQQLESELKRQQEGLKDAKQENKQLRLSCDSLSRNNQQLLQKYRQIQSERSLSQSSKVDYGKEYGKMKQQIEKLSIELQQRENSLITIDNERDQLQNILDEKTEENDQLKRMVQSLERQLATYGRDINENSINLQGLSRKCSDLEAERKRMVQAIENLQNQNSQLRNLHNRKEKQVGQISHELSLAVLANKNQKRQCQELKSRLMTNQQRERERMKDEQHNREQIGAQKVELKELRQKLQEQRNETLRLAGYVRELEDANREIYENIQQKDHQIAQMDQVITHLDQKEQVLTMEIENYRRDIENISNRLQITEKQLRIAVDERNLYLTQTRSKARQSNVDWRAVLEQKNYQLLQDIQCKKRQIQTHKIKARDMEAALKEERRRNFHLQRQFEKNKTNHPANQTPIRMVMVDSSIDHYNDQNWNTDNQNSHQENSSELFDSVSQSQQSTGNQDSYLISNSHLRTPTVPTGDQFEGDQQSISSIKIREKLKKTQQAYKNIVQRQGELRKKANQ